MKKQNKPKFRDKVKRLANTKRCPRCGTKCMLSQNRCPECDLIFSRLEFASNKAAKKQLRKFNRDFVVYTKDLPKDVSFIKLLLLTIFCGLFGAQYYYVGKYEKGILMTISFVYLVLCTIFNAYLVAYMETMFLYFPIGVAGMAWMVSIVYVASRKFKVPILIDMPTAEIEKEEKSQKNTEKTVKNTKKTEKIDKKTENSTEKVEEILEKIDKAQQKEEET